jgi:hypothetical protein
VLGECNHSFHMVCGSKSRERASSDQRQHCIFSWLRQEAAQEKCPMCRQRKLAVFPRSDALANASSLQEQEPGSRRHGSGDASHERRHESNLIRPILLPNLRGSRPPRCPCASLGNRTLPLGPRANSQRTRSKVVARNTVSKRRLWIY